MKKRKIVYMFEREGIERVCVVYARNWFWLKETVDGLLKDVYGHWDIISIKELKQKE